MTPAKRPDPEQVLQGLKDFQRDTVEYVFRRLYVDNPVTRRFLVADEVGLGKTLVARGLIARAVDHLWGTPCIDVVYICSNADIAQQNLKHLRLPGWETEPFASRITLLPLTLKEVRRTRGVNFVSFTPGTSFDMKSSLGTGRERALLYHLLRRAWSLSGGEGPKRALQGWKSRENFEWELNNITVASIDRDLRDAFIERVNAVPGLRERFETISQRFSRVRSTTRIDGDRRNERAQVVAELRLLLAQTCLEALEPDLIFLDEFQRFKHLLDPSNEAGQLAGQLFDYADSHTLARVVLLSATPYKMYTLADEAAGEDHYQDFVQTIRFLFGDEAKTTYFEALLASYREEIYRLTEGHLERVCELKGTIEHILRQVMVRTERLAVSTDRDGMLRLIPDRHVQLTATDISSYLTVQQVARTLGQPDVLEYWKSSPYLLNFMDDYKLKQQFKQAREGPVAAQITEHLLRSKDGLLPRSDFEAYQAIDPGNARLRQLLADTVETGAWRWLWIAPSLPYYAPGGPFNEREALTFTKRLIFSSWRVAPKAIATLTSYEVERRMVTSFEREPANTAEARRKHSPLLRLARDEKGGPAGMSVLGLLYPSQALAERADPLRFALSRGASEALASPREVTDWARARIERALNSAHLPNPKAGDEDQRWYWAAPILMDKHRFPELARQWWEQPDLANIWAAGAENGDTAEDDSNWAGHVQEARALFAGEAAPLGKRPADLSTVLADLALAGPGVTALRALARVCRVPIAHVGEPIRNGAAHISWGFRSLFNTREVTALVRGLTFEETVNLPAARPRRTLMSLLRPKEGEVPYWRKVLQYCLAGNVQAVLDEYAHVLREYLGLAAEEPERMAADIAGGVYEALTLRTSALKVDEVRLDRHSRSIELEPEWAIRAHFAVRFGDETSDDGKQTNRKQQVLRAFNSPFWPFVLATTAVGQEGLDFHCYSHAVVHWNLPANPVDLEQREGRVHRYKGHAIRKNVARCFGLRAVGNAMHDPWQDLFDTAENSREQGVSDLIPYWVFPLKGGACIERHIPALPLSRELVRADALRRSLALYRIAFGQARQEDIMVFLLTNFSEAEALEVTQQLQINLEPPHNGRV